MAKVTTSAAGVETTQVIPNEGRSKAADLAAKLAATDAPADPPPPVAPPETAEGLDADDKDLPERAAKRIAKKHREMMEAREAAAESDRFAETQFNEARQHQRRSSELEAELAAIKAQKPAEPPRTEPLKQPKQDDFVKEVNGQKVYDTDAFLEAFGKYTREQAIAEFERKTAEERKKQEDETAAALKASQDAEISARFAAFKAKNTDFDVVIKESSGQLPTPVMEYVVSSEFGPEMYYHYAKNPDEAKKIMDIFDAELKKNPGASGLRRAAMKAVAAIARLETSFEKPAVASATSKPVSTGAPAPITPIPNQGTTVINTDPAKMTYKELRAYERERTRRR